MATIERNVDIGSRGGLDWAQFTYRKELDALVVGLLVEILNELRSLNPSPSTKRALLRAAHETSHGEASVTCDELAKGIEKLLYQRASD